MTDPRPFEDSASSKAKPPSLRSDLLLATRRIELLRKVCLALVLEIDPQKRASLMSMLSIVTHDHDGASDGA